MWAKCVYTVQLNVFRGFIWSSKSAYIFQWCSRKNLVAAWILCSEICIAVAQIGCNSFGLDFNKTAERQWSWKFDMFWKMNAMRFPMWEEKRNNQLQLIRLLEGVIDVHFIEREFVQWWNESGGRICDWNGRHVENYDCRNDKDLKSMKRYQWQRQKLKEQINFRTDTLRASCLPVTVRKKGAHRRASKWQKASPQKKKCREKFAFIIKYSEQRASISISFSREKRTCKKKEMRSND